MENSQKRMTLLSIFFAIGIASLGIGIVIPIIPSLIKNVSEGHNLYMGLSATIMALTFSLASFPIGIWIDKTCSKNAIIFGLIVYGLSMLMFPLFNSLSSFLIIRGIEGIGWGGIWMGTETLINQLSPPKERGRNMGIYGFSIALGMGGGPMIGAWFTKFGIVYPFAICFGLTFLSLLFTIRYIKRSPIIKKPEIKSALSLFDLRVALGAAVLYGIFEASMISMFPIYLLSMSFDRYTLSMVIVSFFVGGILFQIPSGKVADKIGKERVLLIISLLLVAVLFTFSFVTSKVPALILGFFAGGLGGAFYPIGLSIIPDKVKPDQLGIGNANFTFMYGIGSIIGPISIAVLMDLLDVKALFYSFLPLIFIFVVLCNIKGSSNAEINH